MQASRWLFCLERVAARKLRPGYCGMQKQQALLGQMLVEGYGCTADPAAGKDWIDKARRRGYKMSGVYCEI